jgi:hypothetical protein
VPPYFTLAVFLVEGGSLLEIIFLFNDVLYGEKTRERFKNFRSNLLAGQFVWDRKLALTCTSAEKR